MKNKYRTTELSVPIEPLVTLHNIKGKIITKELDSNTIVGLLLKYSDVLMPALETATLKAIKDNKLIPIGNYARLLVDKNEVY